MKKYCIFRNIKCIHLQTNKEKESIAIHVNKKQFSTHSFLNKTEN